MALDTHDGSGNRHLYMFMLAACKGASVAQVVALRACYLKVLGSIPSAGDIFFIIFFLSTKCCGLVI